MKPFGRERLVETLGRVRVCLVGEGLSAQPGVGAPAPPRRAEGLFARRRGTIVPVPVSDVVRIDAAPAGAVLVTGSATLDLDGTLGEIEARLDPSDFVRVHRSHIVNLDHVSGIRRYDDRRLEVRLSDGSPVVASRHGSKSLRVLMG